MTTALTVIALLCIFLLPVGIVCLVRRSKIVGMIGAVACCYLVGFAFSAIGFTGVSYDKGLVSTVAYVLVAISIPLMLFSIDLRALKKLTRGTIVGFALCMVSAITVAVVMFFVTLSFFPSAKISAMIVGLYTGGTPNLNAIGAALGAGEEAIAAANVSDTLVGGVYFLFLISVAPKVYRAVLGRGKKPLPSPGEQGGGTPTENAETAIADDSKPVKKDDYAFGFSIREKKRVFQLIGAFFLAVGCIGVGVLLEFLIEGTVGSNLLYILLSVSVLGIAFSFFRPIREIKGQFALGSYFILMFSLALSMSIDWATLSGEILPTLAFFACAQISVIVLHAVLCKIFRIDADTAIITSTAGVYGPPFIAPVAGAAKRPDLIAPGVICGALGLAIGTLLGLGVGSLLLLV